MAEAAAVHSHAPHHSPAHHAGPAWFGSVGRYAGLGILLAGVAFCIYSLVGDLESTHRSQLAALHPARASRC